MQYRHLCAAFLLAITSAAVRADTASFDLSFFETESAIQATTEQVIGEVSAQLANDPSSVAYIEGYGDLASPPTYYQILDRNRMLRAFLLLTKAGVDPARITMKNLGQIPDSLENTPSRTTLSITVAAGERQEIESLATSSTPEEFFSFTYQIPRYELENSEDLTSFLGSHLNHRNAKIVINTFAGSDGREYYDLPMQRLRGLEAFHALVKRGFPADRLILNAPETTNLNAALLDQVKGDHPKAQLQWIDFAPEEPMAAEPPPAPEPPASEPVVPEPASPSYWSLLVGIGKAFPTGNLQPVAKGDLSYLIGARFPAWAAGWHYRADLSSRKLLPKASDQSGDVSITTLAGGVETLHAMNDFTFSAGGLLSLSSWSGAISDEDSGDKNEDTSTDFGFVLSAGAAYNISETFRIGPDVRWHYISGKFNGSFGEPLILFDLRI